MVALYADKGLIPFVGVIGIFVVGCWSRVDEVVERRKFYEMNVIGVNSCCYRDVVSKYMYLVVNSIVVSFFCFSDSSMVIEFMVNRFRYGL